MLIIISGYDHKTVDETIRKLLLIARLLGSKFQNLKALKTKNGSHRRCISIWLNRNIINAYQRLLLPSNIVLKILTKVKKR